MATDMPWQRSRRGHARVQDTSTSVPGGSASGSSRLSPFLTLTFPSLDHLSSCSPRFFLLGRFVSVCLKHGYLSYFQVWISPFYARLHPSFSSLFGSSLLCFALLLCSLRPAAVSVRVPCISFLIPSLFPISQWLSWIASFSCIESWTEDLHLLGQFPCLGSSPGFFFISRLCSPAARRPFTLLFFFCYFFRLEWTFSHSWVPFLSFQVLGSALPSRLCPSRIRLSCCSEINGLVWFGFGLCAFNSLPGLRSLSGQSFGFFGSFFFTSSFGYLSYTFSFGRCSFDETDHLWTLFFLCAPFRSYTSLLSCLLMNGDCLQCGSILFHSIPIILSCILPYAFGTSPLSGYPGGALTYCVKLTNPHYTTGPGALIMGSMKSCYMVPVGCYIIGLSFESTFPLVNLSSWNYFQSIFASGYAFFNATSGIDYRQFTHEHIYMKYPCILFILFPLSLPTHCLSPSPCLHGPLGDVYEAVRTFKQFPCFDNTSCTGLSIYTLGTLFSTSSFGIFPCGQRGLPWQSFAPLSTTVGVRLSLLYFPLWLLYGFHILFRQAHKNLCCCRDGLIRLVYE